MALASDIDQGGAPVAPAAAIAFTADTTAVKLSATATHFTAGFVVQNQSAGDIYIGDSSVVGAGTGLLLASGASMTIASSDASLWWAYAAAARAGVVQGTR